MEEGWVESRVCDKSSWGVTSLPGDCLASYQCVLTGAFAFRRTGLGPCALLLCEVPGPFWCSSSAHAPGWTHTTTPAPLCEHHVQFHGDVEVSHLKRLPFWGVWWEELCPGWLHRTGHPPSSALHWNCDALSWHRYGKICMLYSSKLPPGYKERWGKHGSWQIGVVVCKWSHAKWFHTNSGMIHILIILTTFYFPWKWHLYSWDCLKMYLQDNNTGQCGHLLSD